MRVVTRALGRANLQGYDSIWNSAYMSKSYVATKVVGTVAKDGLLQYTKPIVIMLRQHVINVEVKGYDEWMWRSILRFLVSGLI
jgi:anti-sigma-K factor RskA